MDFDFSNEQKAIRDEARRLLNAECDLKRVRRVLDGDAGFDRGLWDTIASAGWLGAAIPEHLGGTALGEVTLCVIAEELGRALAPVPVASSIYLVAQALLLGASSEQQARWLPLLAEGRCIGTACLGPAGQSLRTSAAELRFANGQLSGPALAPDALIATLALVRARTDEGLERWVLADLSEPGVRREALASLDPTRPLGRLHFEGVPADPLPANANTLLHDVLDRAAVLVAFEQLGGAQRALETSCDYARLRHAFGRPIGSFQAIKHKLADMYTKIELARANAFHAAWALETRDPSLPLAASAARLAATEAYEFAAKESIQVHGGIGATWEADLHLFYRRSKALMSLLDATPSWRNRLVSSLTDALA